MHHRRSDGRAQTSRTEFLRAERSGFLVEAKIWNGEDRPLSGRPHGDGEQDAASAVRRRSIQVVRLGQPAFGHQLELRLRARRGSGERCSGRPPRHVEQVVECLAHQPAASLLDQRAREPSERLALMVPWRFQHVAARFSRRLPVASRGLAPSGGVGRACLPGRAMRASRGQGGRCRRPIAIRRSVYRT